jgi:hypothetical protein
MLTPVKIPVLGARVCDPCVASIPEAESRTLLLCNMGPIPSHLRRQASKQASKRYKILPLDVGNVRREIDKYLKWLSRTAARLIPSRRPSNL